MKETEKYIIEKDEYCYILKVRRKVMDEKSKNYGEMALHVDGYYPNIRSLLAGMLDRELIGSIEAKELLLHVKRGLDKVEKELRLNE